MNDASRSKSIVSGSTRSTHLFTLAREDLYVTLTSLAERGSRGTLRCAYSTMLARRTETVRRVWASSTARCSGRAKNASKRRYTTAVRTLSHVFLVLADCSAARALQIAFLEANAQELPAEMFPDNTHNIYTIALRIRNVTSIADVLPRHTACSSRFPPRVQNSHKASACAVRPIPPVYPSISFSLIAAEDI